MLDLRLLIGGAIIAVGTVAAGYYQGTMSHRWEEKNTSAESIIPLKSLPERFGDWQMTEEMELDATSQQVLQCDDFVFRTYRNDETNQEVRVVIVAGPPGPTAAHIPEICYNSQDYKQIHDRTMVPVGVDTPTDGTGHSFWGLGFRANDLDASQLSVYYAWSTGEYWKASDVPRLEFGGASRLFKLQVAGMTSGASSPIKGAVGDACFDFLTDFVAGPWPLKKDGAAVQPSTEAADPSSATPAESTDQ